MRSVFNIDERISHLQEQGYFHLINLRDEYSSVLSESIFENKLDLVREIYRGTFSSEASLLNQIVDDMMMAYIMISQKVKIGVVMEIVDRLRFISENCEIPIEALKILSERSAILEAEIDI
jgi:hypothetical protein